MDDIIGIDLGTRFSCVSIWRNKRFEIISDQYGNRTIPSIVCFFNSIKLIGYNAIAMKEVDPLNTIFDIKRIIGRKINDPIIEQIKKLVPYNLVNDDNNIAININNKKIKPEEICAYILIELKKMASKYLSKDITKAIITVPAYFNDSQRQATLDSALIAGLDVLKIINEPTAAALAYGLGNKNWKKNNGGNIIIYDLGAGTLDVSLMNINDGVFRTLAVGGNTHLGGEDIDYLIMNHIILNFKKKFKIKNIELNKLIQYKLKNIIENSKKILSSIDKTLICLDDFYNGHKLYESLTRETLENICNNLFILCIKPLQDVLNSSGLSKDDIDDVILVGGSTRIPKIQELILEFFKHTNITQLTCSLNPDEVVSAGASIYGYIITHEEDPFSQNLVLLDITPLSLGIETLQNQMTVIIPRNTVIPTKKVKIFSTDTDNQDTVLIKIFEGERKLTKNNFHVGTFELSGFKKGPRGYPMIKITFHVDINGILQVIAHEKKSDVQNGITITSTWGAKGHLSKKQINKLIIESKKNEEEDNIASLKIGLIYKINNLCSAALSNLDNTTLNKIEKKRIKIDLENNLNWIEKNINLSLNELENKEKELSKSYSHLIIQNKKEYTIKEKPTHINATEIYGDDEEDLENYEQIKNEDEDKEEIKALKKIISDLSKNILNIINNPISNFTEEDVLTLSDYLNSVQIWIYTNSATTSLEYVSKINEINEITEEIMKKYEKNIFTKNEQFSLKDELHLTCLTLNSALQSNFFSLEKSDIDKLINIIDETLIWVSEHPNENNNVYQDKLDEISNVSNDIYNNMQSDILLKIDINKFIK